MKKILNGGGSLSEDLIKEATLLFSNATIFSAYGMNSSIFLFSRFLSSYFFYQFIQRTCCYQLSFIFSLELYVQA